MKLKLLILLFGFFCFTAGCCAGFMGGLSVHHNYAEWLHTEASP